MDRSAYSVVEQALERCVGRGGSGSERMEEECQT